MSDCVSTQATIHGDPYPEHIAALASSLAEAVALLRRYYKADSYTHMNEIDSDAWRFLCGHTRAGGVA